jgi:hypothetical protein
MLLVGQGAQLHAKKVRPQNDRKHAFPKGQVQEADGEKPSGKPEAADETVLFDFDIFHGGSYTPFSTRN